MLQTSSKLLLTWAGEDMIDRADNVSSMNLFFSKSYWQRPSLAVLVPVCYLNALEGLQNPQDPSQPTVVPVLNSLTQGLLAS